jgi:hypothetical protein
MNQDLSRFAIARLLPNQANLHTQLAPAEKIDTFAPAAERGVFRKNREQLITVRAGQEAYTTRLILPNNRASANNSPGDKSVRAMPTCRCLSLLPATRP